MKKRSSSCYQNKIKKITEWYNDLQEARKDPKGDNLINPNTKAEPKKRELKPLEYYLDLLKKEK
jgi:hypothetical protein